MCLGQLKGSLDSWETAPLRTVGNQPGGGVWSILKHGGQKKSGHQMMSDGRLSVNVVAPSPSGPVVYFYETSHDPVGVWVGECGCV